MKRLVCKSFGDPNGVAVEHAPDPEPGPREVLIRMTAANVSFVDRLIVRGAYQVRPPLPFTGAVGAGEVLAAGTEVTHLTPGTSVIVLKSDYGTWATHIVAPATSVVPIPPNVPDEIAAAAIETAVHLDAQVIAVTSEPDSWDDHPVRPHVVIDRRAVNLREAMKARFPDGIDLVLDPVGGDLAELALRSLGPRGRYLVVGFASGQIPTLPANQILLRNRTVVGVEWATWITANPEHLARTLEVVLNRLARGVLRPPKPTLVDLDELPEVLLQGAPGAGLIRTVAVPSSGAGEDAEGGAGGQAIEVGIAVEDGGAVADAD